MDGSCKGTLATVDEGEFDATFTQPGPAVFDNCHNQPLAQARAAPSPHPSVCLTVANPIGHHGVQGLVLAVTDSHLRAGTAFLLTSTRN